VTPTVELHVPPELSDVVRAQFKATGKLLRAPMLVIAAIGTVITLLSLLDYARGHGGVEFAPELSLIPAFVGALLPVLIWQKEKHFESGFMWTLPVDRSQHAAAKVIAGWIWLMIGASAFVAWLLIIALITRGNIGDTQLIRLLPTPNIPPGGTLDPAMLREIQWKIPTPLWLVPFTAATGMYVIASAFMAGLRYPVRWIIAAIAAGFLVAAVGQGVAADAFWLRLQGVMNPLSEGRYGLDALLSGRTESMHTRVTSVHGVSTEVWRALPRVRDWIIATILWTSCGFAALLAALFRHRERR
jgi:hypothetical protein